MKTGPYEVLYAELQRFGLSTQGDLHVVLDTIEHHAAELGGMLTTIQIQRLTAAVRSYAEMLASPNHDPPAVERALLLAIFLGQQVAGKSATKVFGPAIQERANRDDNRAGTKRKVSDAMILAAPTKYRTKREAADALNMDERTVTNRLAALGTSWRKQGAKAKRGNVTPS